MARKDGVEVILSRHRLLPYAKDSEHVTAPIVPSITLATCETVPPNYSSNSMNYFIPRRICDNFTVAIDMHCTRC